ncbi:MAG: radical SAM protein, partial [Vicinamibacteria bacterium]
MGSPVSETLARAAGMAWQAFQAVNQRIPESPSIQPKWASSPLPKSRERTKPPLGWPRETDSLCPGCVVEVREAILRGERKLSELLTRGTAEIPASIVEERGRILIRKRCSRHGPY